MVSPSYTTQITGITDRSKLVVFQAILGILAECINLTEAECV